VPLQGLVVATPLIITADGEFIFNPSKDQLDYEAKSFHVVAYEFRANAPERLLLCESTGSFTQQQLFECLDQSIAICQKIYSRSLRPALAEKVRNDFIWKE
jgi:ribonuclease PH